MPKYAILKPTKPLIRAKIYLKVIYLYNFYFYSCLDENKEDKEDVDDDKNDNK